MVSRSCTERLPPNAIYTRRDNHLGAKKKKTRPPPWALAIVATKYQPPPCSSSSPELGWGSPDYLLSPFRSTRSAVLAKITSARHVSRFLPAR
jgi:hypothetical protein